MRRALLPLWQRSGLPDTVSDVFVMLVIPECEAMVVHFSKWALVMTEHAASCTSTGLGLPDYKFTPSSTGFNVDHTCVLSFNVL